LNRCDVDIVDCAGLSHEVFNASYLSPGRPALLAGCAKGRPAEQLWSRRSLVERYGDVPLNVGRIAFPETYGQPGRREKIADIVADAEGVASGKGLGKGAFEFAFDHEIVQKTRGKVSEDFVPSPLASSMLPVLTEFNLGPPRAGANLHFHGMVFAGLVHGRKRWALLPPAKAYFSLLPGPDWLDSSDAALPWVRHCVQRAGDIMFVPRNWGHATVNLQTAVALVHEYD